METNRRTFIKQSALSVAALGGGITSPGMNHTPGTLAQSGVKIRGAGSSASLSGSPEELISI